ncbi:glyoxalase [Bordetella genomosp. 9]|uniref:VOC family protein n=1 Tax=Bordetella genomosp. 9 TaxID=1416803 RepID=UPI000A297BEA|nr:VOC family protein [Bordetella genomosp. 9]ARP92662.1 glyoxalase [Bordetella genomosp. 9]
MPTPSSHAIPPGMHALTPHLICNDGAAAIDFYKQAFGATEEGRMMDPEGKRLMHAMLRIGDSALMLADAFPQCGSFGPQAGQPSSVLIHLYVADVDAVIERAVAAGAKVIMPPSDMFWGDRYGQIEDPQGHRWSVATHKFDMTPEEMKEGMQRMMSQQR